MCPHYSKTQTKCPFLCNLGGLLESFADAKIDKKYMFPAISEDLSFKNVLREHAPRPCSLFAMFYPPDYVLYLNSRSPAKVPFNICATPTYNGSYVPGAGIYTGSVWVLESYGK